jgi:peptidoglycan/xylan/chitin deacetylase (PgdA/CDA1 family)
MIRTLALLFVAASLTLTGCDKIPGLKKKTAAPATPSPVPVATAVNSPTAPASAPARDAAPKPPAAPKMVVDPHAEVVVMCYHRLEGKAGGALSIEPALFEQQMQRIKDSGIPVIPMQDFLAWRRGEKNIPPKSIIITIDDGYVSGYDVGWPILKKFGFPFTMYVYLTYINTGGKAITWAQLAEMRDAGVDIGSHTVLHADLKVKPKRFTPGQAAEAAKIMPMDYDTWLKYEMEHSKEVIEEKLGIKCNTIAYPYGLNNEKVREAAKTAGYEAGFTTYGARLSMTSPAMGLGRYDVTTKDAKGVDSFTVGLSFKGMAAPGGDTAMAQEAATAMVTEPPNGENITDPTPTLKANLEAMGALDDGSVAMRVSSLGQVPAKYDKASNNISYTVGTPLKPGSYRVIISAKSNGRPVETAWSFTFYPDGVPPAAETPTTTAPAATPEPPKKKKK